MVGFGGGGTHFCLGASLARREMTVMFDEIFRNLPDLQITGPIGRLQGNFVNGIKTLPCEFSV
jgi:cytochrome P450